MGHEDSVNLMCSQIIEEAQKEAGSILEKANVLARQCISSAQKEAESNAQKIIAKAKADSDQAAKKIISTLQIEKRKFSIKKEEELISLILKGVDEGLEKFANTTEYIKFLKNTLVDIAGELGVENITVIAGKNDPQASVSTAVKEALIELSAKSTKKVMFKVDDEKHPYLGFIMRTENGNIQINATLNEKLRSSAEDIRALINERLFK